MTTRYLRLVSGFAAAGTAFGLIAALVATTPAPAASAAPAAPAGRAAPATVPAACRAPAPRSVQVTGHGKTGKVKDARPAPQAAIRVDQVGYPAGAAKQAEIMTKSRHPGKAWTRWELVSGERCTLVATGTARQDLGQWSGTYPAVWAVSFSNIHRAGTYRLVLTAHPQTVSPWFRIAKAAALYRKPLANALSFYQNERDGPEFIPSKLRAAAGHRNDLRAMTYRQPKVDDNGNFKGSLAKLATGLRINATGGWFDAGDYLHFTETTSYTVGMLLQAVAAFPKQTGSRGQVNFSNEAKFGLDFLRHMWNEKTRTLYMQVGTGEANSKFFGDHDIWRLPQADDHYMGTNPRYQYIRHPPVFRAGRPGAPISPNLAGRLSADFALCYRVYRATSPAYANGCLRSAETIYAMAALRWKGHLETALPWDFYPETSWRDDMMLGATELALALHAARPAHFPKGLPVTSSATYLRDAAHWANAWIGSKADGADTLNLYDVSALADYELDRAIAVMPGQQARITRSTLLADLRKQIRHAIAIGNADPFDYGFAWDQWDTTAHGFGLAVMGSEYDALVRQPVYAAWGQRQLDGVFGANAWGISLVVGDGTVYPDCMQHQVANLAGSDNGKAPVLAGAVVEGPNSFSSTGWVTHMKACRTNAPGNVPYRAFDGRNSVFADNVQSFDTVEPAIDLTALSPLAFAWQEAGTASGRGF